MESLIQRVAELRDQQQRFALEVKTRRAEWEQENAELLETEQTAKAELLEAENELRAAILAQYAATGNKKPAEECGVRVSTKFVYDPQKAIDWATQNASIFLKTTLDAKAFEAHLKSNLLDFVEKQEIPTATIATELK